MPKQNNPSHSDSYSAITNLRQSDLQTTSQHDSGRASLTGDSGGHPARCNVSSGMHCLTCPVCHGQVREEIVRTPDIRSSVGGRTGPQDTNSPRYCHSCGARRQAPSGHHDDDHSRVRIRKHTYTHTRMHAHTRTHAHTHVHTIKVILLVPICNRIGQIR
ncbi:hypothetical protein NP493_243g03087 [Ridgeia piscesae]|uniref:Uncharacterized protein n=1 Tax=Ridgeia piscesae TaxID=27915 RepID=A0AAD9NZA2_RIDPI|nr:hypothetical protein NP493_243g03087 [Ridgeia piscesae]